MKTILKLTALLILTACGRQIDDIKIDSASGDTLQVIKRHADNKYRETIFYKNNLPDSNICFSDIGDTLKFPKVKYLYQNKSVFIFIPIQRKYQRVGLLFQTNRGPNKSADSTIVIEPIRCSGILPLNDKAVINKKIKGAIKCKSPDGTFDFWNFEEDAK